MHAPLLAVTSAPTVALPSRVTLVTTTAIINPLTRAATTVVFAVASTSRALTRSPSANRPDSESWAPSSPIHPLVLAPAPSPSSLDTSLIARSPLSSSFASRLVTRPVTHFTSPSADFARPPSVIIPAEAAVAIMIEPTTYKVIGYSGLTLILARRFVAVDNTGDLADWRVQCDAPTFLTHYDPFNAPDPEVMHRVPLKTYTEALRGLSQILARRYMVFHDRVRVFKALSLSLPLDRTTDSRLKIPIRTSALCVGGTCWCRSRNTLVELEVLWRPQLGG